MPKTVTPLTHTGIQAARPAEKEYTLQDGNGLYLLIKPNGSKIWRFRYTRPGDGQRVLMSFGSLDEVTLADARKRREEYRALLAKGTDPQTHQKQQTEAELMRRNNTFRKVAANWYEMKRAQNLAPNTIKDIWRSLEKYVFPDIGDCPVNELTARQFVTLLEPIKARGNLETLKRVLQRINEVMDYAANSGLTEFNTAANVRKAFPTPVKVHMPTIRPEQLPELMSAVSVASIERQTRLLIEWQLLT
ncbi:integrase arm-type DNA-binding domain-containing protein, partial [Salmonella enterica]|nr:integrase arm-type DNA-binding domain-containing protein [Salmonella enterica]